ncbi:hypothetical protein [Streptomyces sp. NPDC060194]|uniref:hypothetical protein n=1 Tax=Streptomyces sp. NPDC060194 TaxID=3347069 RepID=UPI003662C94F
MATDGKLNDMSETLGVGEWVAFSGGLELMVDELEPFAPTHLDRDHHDGDAYVRFTVHARNTAPPVRRAMRAQRKENPRRARTSGDLSEVARTRLVDEHTRQHALALTKARAAVRMRVGARVQVRAGDVPAVRTHDPEQEIVEGLHTEVRRRRTRSATYAFRLPAEHLDDVHIVLRPSVNELSQGEAEWAAALDAPPEDLLDDLDVREPRRARPADPVDEDEDDDANTDADEVEDEVAEDGAGPSASRLDRRRERKAHKREALRTSNGAQL